MVWWYPNGWLAKHTWVDPHPPSLAMHSCWTHGAPILHPQCIHVPTTMHSYCIHDAFTTDDTQDIRSFFGKTANKDGTPKKEEKKHVVVELSDDDEQEQVQKNRKDVKSERPSRRKAAASKRRKVVVDSDDEDDDFMVELESSEDEDFQADEIESDEVLEITPKKRKGRTSPAKVTSPTAKARTPRKSTTPSKRTQEVQNPAAVKMVDEAIKDLPPEKDLKFSLMQRTEGAAWGQFQDAREEPPNLGMKQVPRGADGCLEGKTFVISGVLDSLTRESAEDLIKRHGGRVTSAVSGKTTFLLVGENTGNSKMDKARKHSTKLIDEDGLFLLLKAAPFEGERAAPERPRTQGASADEPKPAIGMSQVREPKKDGWSASAVAAAKGMPLERVPQPSSLPPRPLAGTKCSTNGLLWVTKYKPKTSQELVGNGTNIATLRHWLQEWERVHLRGMEPTRTRDMGQKDRIQDMKKKAVLISGPPGIGKTSAATILCSELNFQVMEVNASDTRNKADNDLSKGMVSKKSNMLTEMVTNTAIGGKKLALIMDEVDGLAGNEDRGGVADLIQKIKFSKIPIICICNDKYSQKLRSLKNYCMDLEFRRPTKQQIAGRMQIVAEAEGLQVDPIAMETLVEACNQDIRLILNQLQIMRVRMQKVTFDDIKGGSKAMSKDMDMSPFTCTTKLFGFESSNLSINERSELAFADLDLIPLLIHENYLNHRPSLARDEMQRLKCVAKAADAISLGDVVNRSIRQKQNWNLMPFAAIMSAVYPTAYMRGPRETFGLYPGEPNFNRFTAWLGQNSSQGKQMRILGEVRSHLQSSGLVDVDSRSVRLEYLPFLKERMASLLRQGGKDSLPELFEFMDEYCVTREDFDSIVGLTKFKTKSAWGADPLQGVPTAVKSAFTREYNKASHAIHAGFMLPDFKRRRGKASALPEQILSEDGEEGEDVYDEGEEEEEEDEGKLAADAKLKKLSSRKLERMNFEAKPTREVGKGKATTGGRGRGRGRGRGK